MKNLDKINKITDRIAKNWQDDKSKSEVLRKYLAHTKRFKQHRVDEYRREENDLNIL